MKAVYLGDFTDDKSILDTWSGSDLKGAKVLLAWYGSGGYDGQAFVLFERTGKLYEVNDGHCSCNGLEFWQPEETSIEALEKRTWGDYAEDEKKAGEELKRVISILKRRKQ